ncbi:MAG: T9SS type A sorting domain-containing protein, partial [Ignavibacteria bacterium]|nr:T9SS type A sorting domain-containing protein [Ignavibacteria bacterium]
ILVDQNLKPGKYSVNFNASNLASGIYFYRLQTKEYNKTKKLVLVK